MCRIVENPAKGVHIVALTLALKRLEYRGYDLRVWPL